MELSQLQYKFLIFALVRSNALIFLKRQLYLSTVYNNKYPEVTNSEWLRGFLFILGTYCLIVWQFCLNLPTPKPTGFFFFFYWMHNLLSSSPYWCERITNYHQKIAILKLIAQRQNLASDLTLTSVVVGILGIPPQYLSVSQGLSGKQSGL